MNESKIHLVKGNQMELVAEDRKKNPFKYFILDKMDDGIFWSLFGIARNKVSLEDINRICGNQATGEEVSFTEVANISEDRNNAAYFSSNGFVLQLRENVNSTLVQSQDRILKDRNNLNVHYALMGPDASWEKGEDYLSYEEGVRLLKVKAQKYQEGQLAEFKAGVKN